MKPPLNRVTLGSFQSISVCSDVVDTLAGLILLVLPACVLVVGRRGCVLALCSTTDRSVASALSSVRCLIKLTLAEV